ncbi:FhaA domain-containing protein [Microbacterium gorillae]|uniref:FhaA domain-containing protein n=1 Tax=Microbacterium gorillae TaxID=1231063 RepID=UPI00058F59F4|nr:DUF3662 and FHA domain-containing protein [Microbacterium gorillae]
MGLLDSFEKGLERAVNGAFAKTFRSGIQPVEIASALRREIDVKSAVVSRDRILAPNTLRVLLSPADEANMASLGSALTTELDQLVRKHAKKQGYAFAGPVSISITADPNVPTGTVRVESSTAKGEDVRWIGVVDVEGKRHPLTKARTVIGRGSDADITISDANTSRKHVEIVWDGKHAMARDLGSTNGSKLNGAAFTSSPLEPDSVITIGRTKIAFRIVAQATRPARRPVDDSTRIFDAQEYDR